jgi:bifunctional non-homologous end joining protein LigD
MGLEEYKRKRDFQRTPEPAGAPSADSTSRGLGYVIQKHDASRLHYDLRLELDGVFKSWAVPKGPSVKAGVRRLAVETEDHPLEYGDFEGVIPAGEYGGGAVLIWDQGTWIPEGDPRAGYREGRLRFRLEGEKLYGTWILTRMGARRGERKPGWLLIKSRDAAAREPEAEEVTEERPRSVVTGRGLAEVAAAADRVWETGDAAGAGSDQGTGKDGMARESGSYQDLLEEVEGAKRARLEPVKPQLATLARRAPEGEGWLHEIKFDGYRVTCSVADGRVRIMTRNGKDWTDRFGDLVEALEELECEAALLDGEVVVLDRDGVSRFQRLQNALSGTSSARPLLYVFDLLHLDGRDLAGARLLERKAVLRALISGKAGARVRYSDHVRGEGPAFHAQACAMGVEGIISKRADAPYRSGRGKTWLKVKCLGRQEFVVVGYTEPAGTRVGLGALVLAAHDDQGRLRYAGRVGTGFDDRTLRSLAERLGSLEMKAPAVVDPPRGPEVKGVHWVRPTLVVEVAFTEWTEDGRIRHPSYKGIREDKSPEEVVREAPRRVSARKTGRKARAEVRVAGVRISNPQKMLWAGQGVTKADLVGYYEAVAEALLPQLRDRPLTLVRCPSGADGKCFYQKHANESVPATVPRVDIGEDDGEEPYMYVDELPALITLVQLGVLEFHVWGSRRDRLDRPDRLVFDLDPDEALPFGRVVEGAFRLRELLEELGLESFPKTTGGKGLHVVVPIDRRTAFDDAKAFTHAVARRMAAGDPSGFTANMAKRHRKGRIFVDYLRNAWNATAIADYSTRARPGAPVAVPVAWDELNPRARKPLRFTMGEVPARLADRADPWPGYDRVRQSITVQARQGVGLDGRSR